MLRIVPAVLFTFIRSALEAAILFLILGRLLGGKETSHSRSF